MIKNIVLILTLIMVGGWETSYGQTLRFKVEYEGKTLKNKQIVEIRNYSINSVGEMLMQFRINVTNTTSDTYMMQMQREEIDLQDNTVNTICWESCMEPDVNEAVSKGYLNPNDTQEAYTDFYLNYEGEPVIGTTVIKYTFATDRISDATLTVEVHYIYDGPATSTKEGSVLTLSGGWSKADLEALDLSDISLTGLDMTGIYIPEDAPALSPANPNLLIYVGEGVNVPSTWKNVVKGTSAESIELKDGYTFKSMKEFTAKTITYSRNFTASDWSTISIPFSPVSLPEKVKVEQFTEALNNGVRFEGVDLISPNTPYIISAEENGEVTFAGAEATISVSTNGSVAQGSYTFQGCSESVATDQAISRFTLNSTGTEFRKDDGNVIPAFRGYIQMANTDENIIAVTHGRENSIDQDSSDALVISVVDGHLHVSVKEAQTLSIYEVSGICIKKVNLVSGSNSIPDLAKGVYLIAGKKVIL